MSTFVLVHGAWHGAWCWSRVCPLVESRGHRAIAIDLPAHGDDPTPPHEATLTSYARSVEDVVLRQPAGRAILVGHSMGGIAISQAAERIPDRVEALVYVAAFLLRDEESLSRAFRRDAMTQLPPAVTMSPDLATSTLPAAAASNILYNECSEDDARRAAVRLCPEPRLPSITPLHLTAGRYGAIPRFYVQCLRDRAVSPAFQRDMFEASPCARVWTLDCDHSPFLSAPQALADVLAESR